MVGTSRISFKEMERSELRSLDSNGEGLMPTNRSRRTRTRIGPEGLSNQAYVYYKWSGTIGNGFSDGKTQEEILEFWREHRDEIMKLYLEDLKKKGAGWESMRPRFYFNELEEKRPRRKTGKKKWIGPVRSDDGDRTIIDDKFETDFQYLKRLGLLEPWELELKKGR